MYPSLWGGFPWFNVHEDRQGAYYSCCSGLLHAPPNVQVRHKAFFGASGRRARAHTRPAWPKIPSAPLAFPLLGAPQAPGNKPNSPKGVKPWVDGPLRPEEISSCRDTLGQIRAAASTAGRRATQQLERCSAITAAAPFISCKNAGRHKALSFVGKGKGAVLQ